MPLDPEQPLRLIDSQSRWLGEALITRIEGNRVFATFTPRADFSVVRALFDELEAAANDQLFIRAGEMSEKIDSLGLQLASDGNERLELCDVQIMNGTDLSCRVPNLALIQSPQTIADMR